MGITIKRPEATYKLCTDMSLRVEWELADEQLRNARSKATGDRLTGNAEATRLAEQVQELERQMEAATIVFRLRALMRPRFNEIVALHPPRQDNDDDKEAGLNRETFFDALLMAKEKKSDVGTIVEVRDANGELVDFDPESEWPDLADQMTDLQYQDIANLAYVLNRGRVSIPFSRAASRMTQTSDETSAQPDS